MRGVKGLIVSRIICIFAAEIVFGMGEEILDFGPVKDTMQGIIKVIGVGGGGCNAVRNMYNEGVEGVTYAVCNTDSQSLSRSPVPVKIMLGESGLGAGANPELGKKEAEANIDDIMKLLSDGTKMVFVTAGMGGGTGTGAAPVVAGVAKEMGLLTVGVVTIPFYFEKKRKIIKALKGVDELRKNVDALLIVNNERLCDVYADSELSVKEAFQRADNILMDAVKGISELITMPSDGGIKSDFRDVETTMRNGGGAIMAMGRASGDHRVQKAIVDALDSPLLYGNDIGKAKRILFNIYASDEYPIYVRELQEIDFLTPLEIEHVILAGNKAEAELVDILQTQGYNKEEIYRSLDVCKAANLLDFADDNYAIKEERRDIIIKYSLLDCIANFGHSINVNKEKGILYVPGFSNNWGMSQTNLLEAFNREFPDIDLSAKDILEKIEWLIENEFVILK